MRIVSLCSGVLGLELGIKLARDSARCVAYVEREIPTSALLVARMEGGYINKAPLWSCIETFDGKPWRGAVDCVSGSYPCLPYSKAGKQRGQDDPRDLWKHFRRIIGEIKPQRVFFENVAAHLSMGFEQVADDLQEMDYRVTAGLFTALEIGSPQRRNRLFIMGSSGELITDEQAVGNADISRLEGRSEPIGISEYILPAWPPSPEERDRWRQILEWSPSLEPSVCGVVAGHPNRVDRLISCGNSVVPLVAAYAWRVLENSLSY